MRITAILIVLALLSINITNPATLAEDVENVGFEKGVSWKPVVPIKKVTFVEHDEESFLDDYAYLAAVPTSVFYSDDRLYSHPLLFYQDEFYSSNEKEITLDARKGIDYFMRDWNTYCDGNLDEIISINVAKNDVNNWNSDHYEEIIHENPFDIAKDLALHDWSFSDSAVISVISEDSDFSEVLVKNKVDETFPSQKIYKLPRFDVPQTNSLNPVIEKFNVDDEYKHILAEVWWDGILVQGLPMIPTGDPDVQLYYEEDNNWIEAATISYWNVVRPKGREVGDAHVYKPGSWQIGITDFPTESDSIPTKNIGRFTVQGSLLNLLKRNVNYHVDITMYPGIEFDIPDNPPFGCRDAEFRLEWSDPSVNLGFSIIGPGGECIFTIINESAKNSIELDFDSLGQCGEGENYSVTVFSTTNVKNSLKIEFEYSWKQEISKELGDSLSSATEGAILASLLNAPLLYTKPSSLASQTEETLNKLGVKNVFIVDIGSKLLNKAKDEIQRVAEIKGNYKELGKTYEEIREISNRNDVIFTTIDPWTYWLFGELKPKGEKKGALFIGPAAYIAAHHGSPVIIVDNHPELSSAVVYHNEFWRRYAGNRYNFKPSTAEMVLTGRRIYDFLRDHGFDEKGDETIITVADQYDIGPSWDRIFPGVANSGRFCGTPVDTSYWISRNVFYPAMIFSNPALNEPVELINGSKSERRFGIFLGDLNKWFFSAPPGHLINLELGGFKMVRSQENEEYNYPVLCSFVTHKHRFNERASKYYGAKYQCPDGRIPGFSTTFDEIDKGSIAFHTNKEGSYYPDMSETEVIPFYLNKGGYDCAFSTKLSAVIENLNKGVILWIHGSHGSEKNGGSTEFWDPFRSFKMAREAGFLMPWLVMFQYQISYMSTLWWLPLIFNLAGVSAVPIHVFQERNPWRGYEWAMGSTDEPDAMTMDIKGILPYSNINIPFLPALGMDWVLARKPVREFLINLPILGRFFSRFFNVDNLYDGVIGTTAHSRFTISDYEATEIEEGLDNLHSSGFITGICQTSNTYFHMMLIRHGSVFQIQDPWPTSWYGAIWRQSIPRDLALGYTIGEAYSRGISQVGILYLGGGGKNGDEPQWWWDDAEGVVYFGDPDLRVFVPGTEYSDLNNWEKPKSLEYDEGFLVNGHSPFKVSDYPHEKTSKTIIEGYLYIILILIVAIILLISIIIWRKKK